MSIQPVSIQYLQDVIFMRNSAIPEATCRLELWRTKFVGQQFAWIWWYSFIVLLKLECRHIFVARNHRGVMGRHERSNRLVNLWQFGAKTCQLRRGNSQGICTQRGSCAPAELFLSLALLTRYYFGMWWWILGEVAESMTIPPVGSGVWRLEPRV